MNTTKIILADNLNGDSYKVFSIQERKKELTQLNGYHQRLIRNIMTIV